jgi:hypothetical protein
MNYYSEKQLAFVNLECLFLPEQQSDPLTLRQEVPGEIHSQAERALDLLAQAGYHEIIFYWPQPLELFPQAVQWLKQHGLRDIWYGTAGQGETRPLILMSSHFDHRGNGTWEHLHWEAAMIQQTLADRQIVKQVFLLDPMAGHVASYVGEHATGLYSCKIFTAPNIEEMLQRKEMN